MRMEQIQPPTSSSGASQVHRTKFARRNRRQSEEEKAEKEAEEKAPNC